MQGDNNNLSYDTKVKKKSIRIVKLLYRLSSRGLWTIPFHPKIYELRFKIDTILSSLEYSFEYKNPFGVDLYVDLEKDNKKNPS